MLTQYLSGDALNDKIHRAKDFEHMGGAMLWDASQVWKNNMYHIEVKKALNNKKKMRTFRG